VGADDLRELQRKASRALSLGSDLVELRVDRLTRGYPPAEELSAALADFADRAILTIRSAQEGGGYLGSEASRLDLISDLAHELRPAYLDIELQTIKTNRRWADSLPEEVGRIVSWHDFEGTPPLEQLRRLGREQSELGSVAKLVTTAMSFDDNLTTLALCSEEPGKIVAFCMGGLGTVSRVVSMRLGAPLAYACLPDESLAPGQLSISIMRALRTMVV
jgi:3-dehydroquinate dehydratase I